jgi:ADP-ribose pyrophosphatase YjhB (NUDIX family)
MSFDRTIRHCRQCGQPVEKRLPDDGDPRMRDICTSCHTVHYTNPLNVVGTVPVLADQVLLCKRNIEPRKGKWTLPAGFMELGESTSQGAARETREESGAEFDMGDLFTVMSVPRVGQVHLYYLAQLHHDRFDPGHETQEARLFSEADIPWDDLAFRTVKETLEHFFADRTAGQFKVHAFDIE